MKRFLPISLLIAGFLTSCSPKTFSSLTVIRDCTGTYLRKDSVDYPVCNVRELEGFSDGTAVHVSYQMHQKDRWCQAQESVQCLMIHPFQTGEWIEIRKAKKAN